MRKFTFVMLSVLILVSMVLSACAPAATPPPPPAEKPKEEAPEQEAPAAAGAFKKDKMSIAWIPKALNNPVFETGKVGAEKKAKELSDKGPIKVEILYTAPTKSDIAEQASVMEGVISKGVDAIGVSCNEPKGCEDPINKAVDANIPVMTWDSDSPNSKRFTYLGVDNKEGGKAAAELMKIALPDGGKVALLTGVPGAANLEARIAGFKEGVQGSKIEVVDVVACNDDIQKGVQVVEETMTKYPDLNGWFLVGLWPIFAGEGAMPKWEEATKKGMKSVAFDTLPVELEWVQKGMLYGLVGQKYFGWGYDTVQMIYDKLVNGKSYEPFTNSGMDIVTICNVDAMAEAWKNNDFTKALPDYKCDKLAAAAPAPAPSTAGAKIGLVTDVGKVNDGTFNQYAYEGAKKAADESKVELNYIETTSSDDYMKNVETFANEGYTHIVTVGFMMGDTTKAAAEKFPKINFSIVDYAYDPAIPNVQGLVFREDQTGFMAGVLAGQLTKSKTVGIVAGMEIPPVKKFRNGYEKGVAYICPDCKSIGVYIDSFTDPARGKAAAESQIAEGADIIFGAGGPTGSGAILGAAQQGVYVIGVDQDEYMTTFKGGKEKGADKIISSAMKRVDVAVYTSVMDTIKASFKGGTVVFDAKTNGVGLAPFHDAEKDIPAEIKTKLDETFKKLASGELDTGVDPVTGDLKK